MALYFIARKGRKKKSSALLHTTTVLKMEEKFEFEYFARLKPK